MLSGMARRTAKSVLAAGQEDLGSSSREERELERGETGSLARGADKLMSTASNCDQENEQDEMETGTVPQLDGADEEKKDKGDKGVKRGRGSMSGAPPTKAMQMSSGERVPTSPGGREEGEEEEAETDKKDKTSKQKQEHQPRKLSTHRPRTRSLSNSDSPLATVGTTSTKTSPMTRSHSAVKKDVEFVSLPSIKKRKKGGGRWPKQDTPSPPPSQEPTTPVKQQKSDSTPSKCVETPAKDVTDTGEEDVSEETPPQPAPPPKRRRGRPPKHQRKDPVTPSSTSGAQSTRGKSGSGGSGGSGGAPGGTTGGRGRGKGRLTSGDSTGSSEKRGGGGRGKGDGDSSKDKPSGENKTGKMSATVKEEEDSATEERTTPTESEVPLPDTKREEDSAIPVSSGTSERKKKRKDRRASGEDGKVSEGSRAVGKTTERASKKKSASLTEGEVTAKQEMIHGDDKSESVESGTAEQTDDAAGEDDPSRPSVLVGVVKTAGGGGEDVASREDKEEEPVSHDGSHDMGQSQEAVDDAAQKPSHIIQNNYSPTLPYPATTIPPFPPAGYPYPGPYPPHLMFPGSSNPMYSPYYPSYPPLPPPPPPAPPTASQPMPGAFIPPCPTEPLPPFSATQPLTTMGGVQVSILDKHPPTILSPHSPHSPHPLTSQQHQVPSTHTVAMELARHYPPPHPHPLSQTYRTGVLPPGPAGGHYMAPNPYVSVRIDPTGMPFVDWGMHHSHIPHHHPKIEDMSKLTSGKLEPKEEVPVQSVECPECGRSFKNNKALNGHMRLHGGFDWTKKPFSSSQHQASNSSATTTEASSDAAGNKPHPPNEEKYHSKKSASKKRTHSRSRSNSPSRDKRRRSSNGSSDSEKRSGEPSVFTFDTSQMHPSQRTMPPPLSLNDTGTMTTTTTQTHGVEVGVTPGTKGATLDDLCRAVEALEKMENGNDPQVARDSDEEDKRRPGNIHIPTHGSPSLERDRHRLGSTPPYTPPPILSPARSMAMLAAPGTPSRILQSWSCRRTSDHRKLSEAEEGGGYLEPKINVGRQFQAVLPPFDGSRLASQDVHRADQVWRPVPQPLEEDESIIDGFLELACSPAMNHAGRNKEYALHVLHNTGGSVKEAIRLLLTGKTVFPDDHPMSTYHYSGSKQWSARERQQFRRAWRVHRKEFHLLKSAVEGKTLSEVTEYYYYWKKYCNDEYRGRNRHISEEILSDEDQTGPRSHSSDSSLSSEVDPTPSSSHLPSDMGDRVTDKQLRKIRGEVGPMPRPPMAPPLDIPIVYAPHSSRIPHGIPVQQYKCKYPGCTQVFTSIFALNGHIRIHGGSFYPKADKKDGRSSSPSRASSSSTPPNIPSHHHHSPVPTVRAGSNGPFKHGRPTSSIAAEMRSAQHLEIARALLDLPQPRSPARGGNYHTPSPKPSPGSKRSPSGKKKMSSSSPGEHEGYYPCNRCGRVFTKVKSRSAHMKSHIMKPS